MNIDSNDKKREVNETISYTFTLYICMRVSNATYRFHEHLITKQYLLDCAYSMTGKIKSFRKICN